MSQYKKAPPKPIRTPADEAAKKARMAQQTNQSYCVEPVDTWFFRESRPHAAIGGQELASLFPPPARSTWGLLAHLLGQGAQVDWRQYRQFRAQKPSSTKQEEQATLHAVHLAHGRLRLRNVTLLSQQQRWYPAPSGALQAEANTWLRLAPSAKPVHTDLGHVFLPTLPPSTPAASATDNTWFSADALSQFLRGTQPLTLRADQWAHTQALVGIEPRLGIAMHAHTRKAQDTMLYQTGHLRTNPQKPWGIAFDATLADPGAHDGQGQAVKDQAALPAGGFCWFGGEGRPAWLRTQVTAPEPQAPTQLHKEGDRHHVLLYFATAADFSHYEHFVALRDAKLPHPPPARSSFERLGLPRTWHSFTDAKQQNATTWNLNVGSTCLQLLCVASPRPSREGGWSLSEAQPTALRSLVPAGTCWYCTTTDPAAALALHGTQLGDDQHLGRGQVFVGTW